MSRSYKHTPRCGDTKLGWAKRQANKKFRKADNDVLYQHGAYKKCYCHYDICDYEEVGTSFEQYYMASINSWIRWGYRHSDVPDRDKEYQDYQKWYIRK